MSGPSVFDRAREVLRIEDLAGRLTKLTGSGDDRRGACPLCDAGRETGSAPFKVNVARQAFTCFACEAHGDVVDLYAGHKLMDGYAAAKELVGGEFALIQDPARKDSASSRPARGNDLAEKDKKARILRLAIETWSAGVPIPGTPAEAYLIGRGIAPELAARVGVRFHPAAPHSFDPASRTWRRSPAMVAKVETPSGWEGGVHVTYIKPDGSAKAELDPAKRMWGPQGVLGLDERLIKGGAWLIGRDAPGDLVVGEGIETTLSLATWLAPRVPDLRVAATLSLGSLQGGLQRDEEGCADMWRPRADLTRPPFLWPPCDTPPERAACGVFIAVDRDMGPIKLRGRSGRGRPMWFTLDAEARARLSARLAAAHWRAKGWAFARPMWPRRGGDWNDVVVEGRAA